MDMSILKESENPLLKRREILATLTHPGKATPLRKDILPDLAKTLKTNEDLVIVDKIFTRKGSPSCNVKVFVYKAAADILPSVRERQERRLGKKGKKPVEGEKPVERKEKPKK